MDNGVKAGVKEGEVGGGGNGLIVAMGGYKYVSEGEVKDDVQHELMTLRLPTLHAVFNVGTKDQTRSSNLIV